MAAKVGYLNKQDHIQASVQKRAQDDEERCFGCGLAFDDDEKIMEACDQDWHEWCFRCYNCAKEFKRDANGELTFALHECHQDGVVRPMHEECSQHYLDMQTKITVTKHKKETTHFNNHIGTCLMCEKEIKGQVKKVPFRGQLMDFHLTCFKCARCDKGLRVEEKFIDTDPCGKPVCEFCGGSKTREKI